MKEKAKKQETLIACGACGKGYPIEKLILHLDGFICKKCAERRNNLLNHSEYENRGHD